MQLLISVEPDTRRVPNLPPPAPRSSHSYLCSPSPSRTPSNALRPTRPPAGAPLAALYRRATLCPFRGGGWRRVTSLSKNGRCRLSLSRSASLSCAPSPSFHLLPALPASSPLFFSLLLSLRFLPFFSRCFSFSPFLSASSVSPFLHPRLSSVISLPRACFSLRSSHSRGRTGEEAAFLSLAATPRVRWSSHFAAAVSTVSSIVARTPALSRGGPHWRVDGGGHGIGSAGRGRGQPGAFSRHGGVRRLARGERRVRERNKISVEGGVRWRRMSSRAGRWKREDEAAAGEHQVRGETGDELEARKRTRAKGRVRGREGERMRENIRRYPILARPSAPTTPLPIFFQGVSHASSI